MEKYVMGKGGFWKGLDRGWYGEKISGVWEQLYSKIQLIKCNWLLTEPVGWTINQMLFHKERCWANH